MTRPFCAFVKRQQRTVVHANTFPRLPAALDLVRQTQSLGGRTACDSAGSPVMKQLICGNDWRPMTSTAELIHKYIAILRCRTWGAWPEWSRCVLPAYEEPLALPDRRRLLLSIHVATYAKRDRPETRPARPLEKAGPIMWRGRMETGYWMGMHFLKAPEDELSLSLNYEQPYEGEIDIQLHIGLTHSASTEDLTRIASPICISVLALINLSAGEFLVPVAPLQVRALGDHASQASDAVVMAVRQRPQIPMDSVKETIDRFVRLRSGLDGNAAQALSVAARRYVASQTETDPIDRYCDLWECCEFATLSVQAKGGKVGRIAEALVSHWNQTSNRPHLRKADVERALEIKRLYDIRERIVHEAFDAPDEVAERTHLLEDVAAELLRHRLSLPFSSKGRVFELLSSVVANKPR